MCWGGIARSSQRSTGGKSQSNFTNSEDCLWAGISTQPCGWMMRYGAGFQWSEGGCRSSHVSEGYAEAETGRISLGKGVYGVRGASTHGERPA